jgi:hypothetical protein
VANPRQFLTGVDFTSNKGINLASPTAATDAANKAYVDALASGLEWKQEVRAATTTNATLATGYTAGTVIDGYTLVLGDRLLIKNQTAQTDNGIYIVTAGTPTRSADANTTASLNNATVLVTNGTTNKNTAWTQVTADPTIGSSNIVFNQFAAGTTYTASATGGLQLVGTAFSVLLPGSSGLSTSASGLTVQLASTPGLQLVAGGLSVLLASPNSGLNTTSGLTVGAGTGITVTGGTVNVDTTVVARKFSQSVGNGSLLTFAISHGLATQDVLVQIYDNGSLAQVEADVVHTSTSVVTVNFTVAPTTNQYRVVVMG